MQSADADIDLINKEIKPIYSSNVQGLLRTKIEAGNDNIFKHCLLICPLATKFRVI